MFKGEVQQQQIAELRQLGWTVEYSEFHESFGVWKKGAPKSFAAKRDPNKESYTEALIRFNAELANIHEQITSGQFSPPGDTHEKSLR